MDRSQLDTLARRYLSTRFDQAEDALALARLARRHVLRIAGMRSKMHARMAR
jgi:hypothetical protein